MNRKLVFVHGFLGGENTWGNFPALLRGVIDCEDSQYGFNTWYFPIFGKSTSVHQLAEGLLSELKANNSFDAAELILVGHSLGGLVIRQLLVNLELKRIPHNIRKVAFFAVPHDGSGFANVLSNLPFLRCNKLKALNKDGTFVEQLNDQWEYLQLSTKLEILTVVGGQDSIVNSNSSKSIFRSGDVETVIDAGHTNIVKPNDTDSLSFKLLLNFINKKNYLAKYKNRASLSYKDWFKLDRHHDLDFVQDANTRANLQALKEWFDGDTPVIRITGLSGLGKSRLIIESLSRFNNFSEENILIFDGADDSREILSSINQAVSEKATGLVIVETCGVELHSKINRLVSDQNNIKIITLHFYHQPVSDCIQVKLDKLSPEQISQILSNNLTNIEDKELKRLVTFIEGFPLLADMLIKKIRDSGNFDVNFTEADLVEKLINGDQKLPDKHRDLLRVISLFDYIKCEKDANETTNEIANFINEIAGTEQRDFENVITNFTSKELINRTGRFARVVPKPLALNLAMQWWHSSLFDRQCYLIENLPEFLIESFCNQVIYLDASINIQDFVRNFCEVGRPFAQADLLLSKAGSRLFRALVEVNPQETCNLLYRTICNLSDEQIAEISGDVRRNLVWSLEMLVFHSSLFERAAWCLFKLAQYENESYGNNATGQFSQLYRIQLPGTAANFTQRLSVARRAFDLDLKTADRVIIEACKAAISTIGGTRTIGAEFQGTKEELKEWHPKTYEQIYAYWRSILGLLLSLIQEDRLADKSKEAFGHEIRGLIRSPVLEMLDAFIKEVIKISGKYWPEASQSINIALEYDSEEMPVETLEYLKSWEELLAPEEGNLEEKLILIVLNPSKEHVKGEDSHYIDVAAQDAKYFAESIKNSVADLLPHLEKFINFPEQKQSWTFAKHLALQADTKDLNALLSELLGLLRRCESINIQFFSGILTGIHERSVARWKEIIDLVANDEKLNKHYPDAIRTGKFNARHLDIYLKMIRSNKLSSKSTLALAYGNVTEHLSEKEITDFCIQLSRIDAPAAWCALDILNLYVHGNSELNINLINKSLVGLVLSVSFKKEDKIRHTVSFHWLRAVKNLLKTEKREFALNLCFHLIEQVGNDEVDYSDLWDYVGEAFYEAFRLYGEYLWPQISHYFLDDDKRKQYRLLELLGSGKQFRDRDRCVFDTLNAETVVNWCRNESALIITGRVVSMFLSQGKDRVFNPLLVVLLAEFGDNRDFNSEILSGFSCRSWSGSILPYLTADKELIEPLTENDNTKVKNWAQQFVEYIDRQIEMESKRESEEEVLRG